MDHGAVDLNRWGWRSFNRSTGKIPILFGHVEYA
jgi:hypothetical protein